MSFKEGKKRSMSTPSADLLVCFPSRVPHHLTLMPSKPICSPARGDHQPNHRHRRHPSAGGLYHRRMKTKQMMSSVDVSEPTSPKVTCSGQIKVKHKKSGGKGSWQSVMEEIERIHKQGKLKQRRKKSSSSSSPWTQSIGFLACLRNIKLDLRCFGVFPQPGMINSDDDEADDDEEEDGIDEDDDQEGRTVFSKWFMVLQEEKEELENNCTTSTTTSNCDPVIPPANALLLMRCRSAPPTKSLKTLMEEEKKTDNNNRLVVMSYGDEDADFYKISSDVAKETWVVGGIRDTLSRSRSWKR